MAHEVGNAPVTLRAGALKLPAVLMQGITHMAPAAGLILSIQFIVKEAGTLTPLAYGIAFLIVLTLGVSLIQLARHLPSAGGYYTYLSRTVHPGAGFLTAWLYFLYDPTSTAINLAYMGLLLQQALRSEWGLVCPWWAFLFVAALLIGLLSFYGVEISARLMLVLGLAEVVIVLLLCAAGLNAGAVPAAVPGGGGAHGLWLGVVLAIFSFTGFESVAPLAEETEAPKKNLPRAILGGILLMGGFYLFTSWALLRGWRAAGLGGLTAFADAAEYPVLVLARRLWGPAWVLILLALFNSVIAVSIACTTSSTRVFYAMGRAGALPRALAFVHPVHRTPVVAIWVQTALTLLIGLVLGFWLGPDQEYFFLGVVMTLGMVLVYSAGNLGVFLFFTQEKRESYNPILHVVFPLFSTLGLIAVGVLSVYPLPPPPIRYAPYVVLVWLGLGILVLFIMRLQGKERFLLHAGQAAFEPPALPPPKADSP